MLRRRLFAISNVFGRMLREMDAVRVERLIRDLLNEGGFAAQVISVSETETSWRMLMRDKAGRVVDLELPKGTPTQLRQAIWNLLESTASET